MANVISGNTIDTSNLHPDANHVDADAKYIDGRNIDHLARVRRFNANDVAVANRVDGIIDSQPANHRDEISEMVRMGQADYFNTLFPDEKSSFPTLWKMLELEPVPPAEAPDLPTLSPLAELVDLQTSVPGELDMNKQIAISRLSQPLQRAAQRIQLVLNSDTDANTISLGDARLAIAEPGRFTPQDLQIFERIERELVNIIRTEPGAMQASLVVPVPGRTLTPVPNSGTAQFNHVSDIRIEDQVQIYNRNVNNVSQADVIREQYYEVTVPADHQLIMMSLDGNGEVLLEPGTHRLGVDFGTHRVELWQNGERVESSEVILPQVSTREAHSIQRTLGVPMKTADGTELVRFEHNRREHRDRRTVTITGRYEPAATVPSARRREISAYNRFNLNLPPGVYELPGRTETLRVFSNRLVAIKPQGDADETFLYPLYDTRVGLRTGPTNRYVDLYLATAANGYLDINFYGSAGSGRAVVRLENRTA